MTERVERRRGPRSDVDVREVILDATEAMAGHTNPDAVSLRAIARAANVAPRALSYHFSSKRELLEAVVRRRSDVISRKIKARLTALGGSGTDVALREVVEAVLQPMVELIDSEPTGGVRWMRVFLNLGHTEDPAEFALVGFDPEVAGLYFEAGLRALGGDDEEGGRQRLLLGILGMLQTLSRVDQPVYGRPLRKTGLDPAFVEQLAIFTSAGIAGHP